MELAQAYRFSRQDYRRMLETGILSYDARIELIEGEILALSPQNKPHAFATARLNRILMQMYGEEYEVRPQSPIVVDDYSEPEPDFAVVSAQDMLENEDHPSQAVLLVEISDSSLAFDRIKKARLYGRAGFPEYWIANLRERSLIVHKQPYENGYQAIVTFLESDQGAPFALSSVLLPTPAE